ncbi:MAG: ABC transporter ATP-binding protein [Candidatus Zixiibacteriota bacterium]
MKVFRIFIPYIKKNWWMYAIGFVTLIIVDGIQLFIPQINKRIIDGLTYGTITDDTLFKYAAIIAAMGFAIGIMRFFWRYMIIGATRRLERDAIEHFYRHVIKMSAKWFDNNKVGDLMALATNDIQAIRMFFGIGFVAMFDAILFGLAALVMLFTINVKLTLLVLIPLPILSIIIRYIGPRLEKRTKKVQKAFGNLTEKTREIFSGIRVVKAYRQENKELENFGEMNDDYLDKNMKMVVLMGLFDPMIGTIIGLAFAIVMYFGGKFVVVMDMSMGSLVAFINYLEYLIWPMMAIGWVINMLHRSRASMRRLNEVLEVEPDIKDLPGSIEKTDTEGKIEFRNLTFSYGEQDILKNINLTIEPGEFVAIVGRTGSGKTSLINIIPRLYDPPDNTVFLDGVDVRRIKLKSLRRHIGMVVQETFLFSESLMDNIRFSNPDASEEEVIKSAKIAQIHEQISEFPKGYQEEIGERGVSLSGGQKQRVAIARTLLKNPPIMIFDDSLSAVDTEIEKKILDGLNEYFGKRTVILISHRISSVINADRIIVLDEGEIVEQGTHKELLEIDGIYAEINRLQALERELKT